MVVRVLIVLFYTPSNSSLLKSVAANTVKKVKVERREYFEDIRIDPGCDFVSDYVKFESGVYYTLHFENRLHRQDI